MLSQKGPGGFQLEAAVGARCLQRPRRPRCSPCPAGVAPLCARQQRVGAGSGTLMLHQQLVRSKACRKRAGFLRQQQCRAGEAVQHTQEMRAGQLCLSDFPGSWLNGEVRASCLNLGIYLFVYLFSFDIFML